MGLNCGFGSAGRARKNVAVTQPATLAGSVDATDRRILQLLRRNARTSYREIGAAVGLSANAATQRMRRMEEAGVIRGYTVLVDPELSSTPMLAILHVKTAVDADSAALEAEFAQIPAITEVLDLAGTIDYSIRLQGRSQLEVHEAVNTIRMLPGIEHIETRVVLRSVLRRR